MPWDIDEAARLDDELCARLDDMTPAMGRAQDVVAAAIEGNFDREGTEGEAWAALAPSTVADRLRKGFSAGPILHRTGNLRAAATEHRQHDRDSLEVGVQDGHPFAGALLEGAPERNLPAREFLVVDDRSIEQIDNILFEHFEAE